MVFSVAVQPPNLSKPPQVCSMNIQIFNNYFYFNGYYCYSDVTMKCFSFLCDGPLYSSEHKYLISSESYFHSKRNNYFNFSVAGPQMTSFHYNSGKKNNYARREPPTVMWSLWVLVLFAWVFSGTQVTSWSSKMCTWGGSVSPLLQSEWVWGVSGPVMEACPAPMWPWTAISWLEKYYLTCVY